MNQRSVAKLLLLFASLSVTWGVLELGARIYKSECRLRNFWAESRDLLRSAYPAEFDEELGWVPKRDMVETENMGRTQVTILPDSTRANGGSPRPGRSADRLQVVDLRYDLGEAQTNDNVAYEGMFNGHMTAEGNHFVARALAREMAQ